MTELDRALGLGAALLLPVGCLPVVIGADDTPDGSASAAPPSSPDAAPVTAEPSIGADLFRYDTIDCQAAVEAACGQELVDCDGVGVCDTYFSCWFGCSSRDTECHARCTEGRLSDEERVLRDCVARNAAGACGAETIHFDRRGAACASCISGSPCKRELTACLQSEGCTRLLGCEGTFPSLAPSQCDQEIPEDLLTPAALQYDKVVTSCTRTACASECNESWGCVGQFDDPGDGEWSYVTGVSGGTLPDGGSFIYPDPGLVEVYFEVSTAGDPPLVEEPFEVKACAKNDIQCDSPLQTVTAWPYDSARFDAFLLGAPFDGFFLIDGPSVYPGRLQSNFPYLAGLAANKQGIDVLPFDVLDRQTIPDFDPAKLVITGSVHDCAALPASGVSIAAASGRVYYLDDNNVPDVSAGATSDTGNFVVVDLLPGAVTLTARYASEDVSRMTVVMMEGRYSGVALHPDSRGDR